VCYVIEKVGDYTHPACTITEVANGALALAAYHAQGADLLITDNDMPIIMGLDLIRALRTQQATIPILMVSSNPTLDAAARAAGATCFLLKPFLLTELQQTLIELLPLSRQLAS
jgi:CheY-like chemotaxis protein